MVIESGSAILTVPKYMDDRNDLAAIATLVQDRNRFS